MPKKLEIKNIKVSDYITLEKWSRSVTSIDVFQGVLFTSDPYVSSIRKSSITISKELLDGAKNLLDI